MLLVAVHRRKFSELPTVVRVPRLLASLVRVAKSQRFVVLGLLTSSELPYPLLRVLSSLMTCRSTVLRLLLFTSSPSSIIPQSAASVVTWCLVSLMTLLWVVAMAKPQLAAPAVRVPKSLSPMSRKNTSCSIHMVTSIEVVVTSLVTWCIMTPRLLRPTCPFFGRARYYIMLPLTPNLASTCRIVWRSS